MADMLTIQDVADFLRVEPHVVQQWLVTGRLGGFDFDGEWRISTVQVLAFLRETQERTAMTALKRSLEDPATWARELDTQPALQADLLAGDYAPHTMGAFLKRAILDHAAAKSAGNVIDIKTQSHPNEFRNNRNA
jgi:Helix-turn-helix domain